MHVRLMVIAATLAMGASANAEPTKPQPAAAQSANRPVEVVLASAETVRSPATASDAQVPAPAKRRAARVTSCRCGDPQPQAEASN